MPLVRVREPFDGDDWIFELKYDGFRALAYIAKGKAWLVSRNGHTYKSFAPLCGSIAESVPKPAKEAGLRERGVRRQKPKPKAAHRGIQMKSLPIDDEFEDDDDWPGEGDYFPTPPDVIDALGLDPEELFKDDEEEEGEGEEEEPAKKSGLRARGVKSRKRKRIAARKKGPSK